MHPQLQEIIDQLNGVSQRLEHLRRALAPEQWSRRPDESRWSPAECVAHLNLTGEAFLPRLEEAVSSAPKIDGEVRYRRDVFGWLLWTMVGPSFRIKVRTSPPFVPTADDPPDVIVSRFTDLQEQQIAIVERCDGLRIDKVKIESPFDARFSYNVYAALTILPRHAHRHLRQAEEAA